MNLRKFSPSFNNTLLKVISKSKIIIEKYGIVKELTSNKIELDNFLIEGNNLIVKRMDGYLIEIKGNITKISFL